MVEKESRRLTEEQLECVNSWPIEVPMGRKIDETMIIAVDILCHFFGYERICKLLMGLEKTWRDYADWPDAIPKESVLLSGLNDWENRDEGMVIIQGLNSLCIAHGYGRMGQLGEAFADMYQSPAEGYAKWKAFYDKRMELLRSDLLERM